MPDRLQVSLLVFVVAILWGLSLFLHGVDVRPEFFRPFSMVSGAVVIVLGLFDRFLWRAPVINGWIVKRPHIAGTWRASFQTTWRNPETGEVPGPTTGFMVVRQTFSNITMMLLTKESSSQFVADELSIGADGRFAVYGIYLNEPKASVRHRSAVHYGALKLALQGAPVTSLEGIYWTDRLTRGDIRLEERRSRTVGSFEEAAKEYGLD